MTDQPPRRTGLRKVQVGGSEAGPPSRPLPASAAGPAGPGASAPATPSSPRPAERSLGSEERARLEAEIAKDAREGLSLARDAEAAGKRAVASAATDAAAAYDSASAQARAHRDDALAALTDSRTTRLAELQQAVSRAVDALAPGTASAGWDGDWTIPAGEASHLRVGSLPSGDAALAPFLDTPGWFVTGRRERAVELVQAAATRVVSALPARSVRLAVFDPRLRGIFGAFGRLRSADAAGFAAPATTGEAFREMLDRALSEAAANAELLSARGAPDMATLRRSNPSGGGASTVVVVLDYPVGIDEQTQAVLERLAESAAPRGVSLLVQSSGDEPAKGVRPERLARMLTRLDESGDGWRIPGLPERVAVTHDGPVPESVTGAVIQSALDRASSNSGPVYPLRDLVDESGISAWSEHSDDAIVAILGRADRTPVTLTLRSENPALPNVLVGGAVGQGKSNLLLDIIYSLSQRYSPEELEVYLLDFKLGLEFRRFDADDSGRNWLPHARVLGLESDRDFGLAVFDHIVAELGRRSDAFKAAKANSITAYRAATGEPLSRILLVVDEFQMLFDGDDEITDAAVARLEQLAKQGRAFGIHLLLSSQTASGISGLRTKGDAIFAQFPVRISLKNTSDESQTILSRHNTAAAELTYRGEFILNRNFGLDPANSNERAFAAFAEPEYLVELQSELWGRASSPQCPLVFLGRDFAQAPPEWAAAARGGVDLAIGSPIAVSRDLVQVRLTSDVDQGVALVGTGDAEAHAVLASAVSSAIAQLPAGSRVTVLDGESDGDPAVWMTAMIGAAEQAGAVVERVDRDAVAEHLISVVAPAVESADSTPAFVVGVALQRVPGIDEDRPANPDDEFDFSTTSGAAVLRRLGERGALRGQYLIGWWSTSRSFADAMNYGHDGIGTYVLLSTSLDDRRSLLGAGARAVDGSPRATVMSRTQSGPARVVVPFDSTTLPGGGR